MLKNTYGQTAAVDSSSQLVALYNAKAVYVKAIDEQLPLYNGPEYYFYNPSDIRGSAYFMDATFANGNVYYDDEEYKGVQLLYDI